MKDARLRFAAIAGVLLLLVGLLVARAERSVRFERIAQHDAIAERLFDEIERELSAFLEREERRPGHAFPGAEIEGREFVVAYFALHPDGERFAVFQSRGQDAVTDHVTFVFNFFDELERLTPAP